MAKHISYMSDIFGKPRGKRGEEKIGKILCNKLEESCLVLKCLLVLNCVIVAPAEAFLLGNDVMSSVIWDNCNDAMHMSI